MSDLTADHVRQGLKRLAARCEGLRSALGSKEWSQIVVQDWLELLHLDKWTVQKFQDAIVCAGLLHTQRNITFAHLRQYAKQANDMPQIAAMRDELKEERFAIEQAEAEKNATRNLSPEIQAQIDKIVGRSGKKTAK